MITDNSEGSVCVPSRMVDRSSLLLLSLSLSSPSLSCFLISFSDDGGDGGDDDDDDDDAEDNVSMYSFKCHWLCDTVGPS